MNNFQQFFFRGAGHALQWCEKLEEAPIHAISFYALLQRATQNFTKNVVGGRLKQLLIGTSHEGKTWRG